MFLIYPIGHDQSIYSQPRITWAITALCVLVFLWMSSVSGDRWHAVTQAGQRIDSLLTQDPDLHVSPELVASVPASLRATLEPLIDDDDVSAELESAVADTVVALRRLPSQKLGYIPANRQFGRAFTSMFAHGGWMHLIGNMILLLLLGSIIEGFWNPIAYIGLYLGAGLVGVLTHHLADPASAIPMVGASGAIAGLISAILIGFARTRITMGWFVFLFVFIRAGTFQMPAWVAAPIWGLLQIFNFSTGAAGGVAYGAHVGGFVFGLLFALLADRMDWIARDAGSSFAY